MSGLMRVRIALTQGDPAAADQALKELQKDGPGEAGNVAILTLRGIYSAETQHRDDAQQALRMLEQMRSKAYLDAASAVEICVAMNDAGCGRHWMELAYRDRSALVVYLPLYTSGGVAKFPGARELLAHIR